MSKPQQQTERSELPPPNPIAFLYSFPPPSKTLESPKTLSLIGTQEKEMKNLSGFRDLCTYVSLFCC